MVALRYHGDLGCESPRPLARGLVRVIVRAGRQKRQQAVQVLVAPRPTYVACARASVLGWFCKRRICVTVHRTCKGAHLAKIKSSRVRSLSVWFIATNNTRRRHCDSSRLVEQVGQLVGGGAGGQHGPHAHNVGACNYL